MKYHLNTPPAARHLPHLVLAVCLAFPPSSPAGPVTLATAPLASATTTSVLPNLMFILDNSGSMGQDYTPDYLMNYSASPAASKNPWTYASSDADYWYSISNSQKNCKDSADDDGSINTALSSMDLCVVGDVPYMTSAINSQYYNPAILYSPGTNADGTSKPSQSTSASVLTDGYNKQNKTQLNVSTTTINLTTGYPDRVWCTINNPTGANLTDTAVCRKNTDYLYPNATYKYGRSSSGSSSAVWGVYSAPYYYDVVPTEYCTAANLKTCTATSTPTGAYTFPAKSRWCSDTLLTTCQATKTSTYLYPRYVGVNTAAVAATGYATVGGTSKNKCFSSIKVNGIEMLGATICWGATEDDAGFATLLKNRINTYNSTPEYTAAINAGDSKRIDITSTTAAGATANGNITYTSTGTTLTMQSGTDVTGGVTGVTGAPYTFVRTDIVPATASYPKATARTDCTGATCTYAQEITNFGNWYAYYRTRMQGMKSAASSAFKAIDSKYRVGFITIASQSSTGNYLPIAKFDNAASGSEAVLQKSTWYTTMFNISPSSSTPLRSALSMVGRIFAGQKPVGTSDPVQYSCQQNFALLTTDGYWNTDAAADVKTLSGGTMGNLDGGTTARPMYEGPTASSASLADAAKYYYDTDLRTSGLGNCTGALGLDVCENNVFVSSTDNNVQQHMTTFTLGLGVDGTVTYSSDYKTVKDLATAPTDARLDYYNIYKGTGTPTGNWPVPTEGNETTVDDLWHAAVNGQGTYFSAKDPSQLTSGLNEALAAIGAKVGSGAAAATSTLNPVAGDNSAYVASYTTVRWTGNLEARSINLNTGVVSEAATWCAENTVAGTCTAPGAVAAETGGSSTIYNCVTPGATADTCTSPGVLVGTDCKVEMSIACTGTMAAKVGATSDTRTIYTKGSAGSLVPFVYANLTATDFNAAKLAGLSQWTLLTGAQQTAATGANLVNYLRGQNGYEDRSSNAANDRLYRYRDAVLGDAVESQPAYIGKPTFSYTDADYSTFKAAQASRAGTVYMGANDGMMHAFNATNGQERWAYVPSMVIPNMWKLADKNYSTMHTYYANGGAIIGDIYAGGTWRTILVAGLNGGGRGYYALDITSPTAPTLLWEYTTTNQNNLGYTFGQPVITKKSDGTWVVLVTSGYNNTSPGNGFGYLYVLNALTGTEISAFPTGVGSSSGLGKIAAWADNAELDNTAGYVYSGDLAGNLWRFDINKASGAAGAVVKFAELKDSSGTAQPITTRPELGKIEGKRVVFVGTGKYLETTDLTDTQQQTFYVIKDADDYPTATPAATLVNPRTALVQQTITTAGATRTGTANAVDFKTGRGWYINLPDSGERSNVDAQLVLGTLLVPTTVPSNTVCSPGGYGWLNFFDYKTGSKVGTTEGDDDVGQKTNAPIVGINVFYLPDGTVTTSVVTSDHPTPDVVPGVNFSSSSGRFVGKRVVWRELLP